MEKNTSHPHASYLTKRRQLGAHDFVERSGVYVQGRKWYMYKTKCPAFPSRVRKPSRELSKQSVRILCCPFLGQNPQAEER